MSRGFWKRRPLNSRIVKVDPWVNCNPGAPGESSSGLRETVHGRGYRRALRRRGLGIPHARLHGAGAVGTGDGYKPVVQFTTAAGRETTFTGNGSHPAAYDPGEAVTVLYDPGDPDDARIKGFWSLWGGPAFMSLLGVIFTVIATGLRGASRSGTQHKEYLRVNGTPIKTEVTGVERNERLEVNGVNPWRITSRGVDPATGEQRDFHSENLWFDPTGQLKVKQVTVLLDPRKPKRYYMDISFLQQPSDE
jgi:hypothetical protein